jgi:biopolymer transport protein ExbB
VVAAAGLDHFDRGSEAVGEAMAGAKARLRVDLERNLGVLGTLGNNAPFIGLFGTVLGIIKAFAICPAIRAAAPARSWRASRRRCGATAIGLMVRDPGGHRLQLLPGPGAQDADPGGCDRPHGARDVFPRRR